MPWAAPKRCPESGHPPYIGARCPACARQYDKLRGTDTSRGYGAQWKRFRAEYLQRHPVCVVCSGIATEVDHIIPLRSGGARFDEINLQSMCHVCHSKKTRGDQEYGQEKKGHIPWV